MKVSATGLLTRDVVDFVDLRIAPEADPPSRELLTKAEVAVLEAVVTLTYGVDDAYADEAAIIRLATQAWRVRPTWQTFRRLIAASLLEEAELAPPPRPECERWARKSSRRLARITHEGHIEHFAQRSRFFGPRQNEVVL